MGGEKAVIFPIHLKISGDGSPKDISIIPHYFEVPIALHFGRYKVPRNLFYLSLLRYFDMWVSTCQQSKDVCDAPAVMQNEGS